MKQLFLHIGSHRTGTTSVQQYLKDNIPQLLENGIQYDTWGYETGLDLNELSAIKSKVRLGISIEKMVGDKVVWSSEGFFGDPWKGYSNIGTVAEETRRMFGSTDTTIIAIIRKKEDFIKSFFSLYKKNVGLYRERNLLHPDFKEKKYEEHCSFLNAFSFNWDELLGEYRKRFDKVRVFNYEGLDVINTILEVIDTPIRNNKEYRLNRSG